MLSERPEEVLLENFVIPARIIYTSSMFKLEDKKVLRTSA
jgi:hypothetical protein